MLKDCNVKYCLIGHSEARQFLKETNEDVKEKFDQLKQESIQPILCIGEPIEVKEASKTKDFLTTQLELIDTYEDDLILAYEPLWAIGTGLIPELSDIQQAIDCIRNKFQKSIDMN